MNGCTEYFGVQQVWRTASFFCFPFLIRHNGVPTCRFLSFFLARPPARPLAQITMALQIWRMKPQKYHDSSIKPTSHCRDATAYGRTTAAMHDMSAQSCHVVLRASSPLHAPSRPTHTHHVFVHTQVAIYPSPSHDEPLAERHEGFQSGRKRQLRLQRLLQFQKRRGVCRVEDQNSRPSDLCPAEQMSVRSECKG